jgi:hypothetical protein
MTGVNQVTTKINDQNAKELDTEYFEVTWHGTARPSHQVWQGKVYTRQELVDICGLGSVSGLCGANCYHSYYPFIPGISERTYTDEQLEEMNAKENERHDYNGKSYNAYEASQRQRQIETLMRKQRQDIKLLEHGEASQDDIIAAKSRYRSTMAQYADFSEKMGLPQQKDRVYYDGLGKVGSGGKLIAKSGRSDIINILPGADKAIIPERKFTEYALNPLKSPDKAKAFQEALGYNLDNVDKLIKNIQDSIKKFDAIDKGATEYGQRYEILMTLTGENGKTANIKSGWIIDKNNNETRLTSAYVTSKKRRDTDGD